MDEITQLREKVRQLTKLLDDQVGTPCEQIRHEQEVGRLRNDLSMRDAECVYNLHKIERLQTALRRLVEHFDIRDEMYTNYADLANNMAQIARRALEGNKDE